MDCHSGLRIRRATAGICGAMWTGHKRPMSSVCGSIVMVFAYKSTDPCTSSPYLWKRCSETDLYTQCVPFNRLELY